MPSIQELFDAVHYADTPPVKLVPNPKYDRFSKEKSDQPQFLDTTKKEEPKSKTKPGALVRLVNSAATSGDRPKFVLPPRPYVYPGGFHIDTPANPPAVYPPGSMEDRIQKTPYYARGSVPDQYITYLREHKVSEEDIQTILKDLFDKKNESVPTPAPAPASTSASTDVPDQGYVGRIRGARRPGDY